MSHWPTELPVRFQTKIAVTPHPILPTPCWLWTGSKGQRGYGRIKFGSKTDGSRRTASVHRVVYQTLIGPIPTGLELDHVCRMTPCCNPAHLEPVTRQENQFRARRAHCPQGHEYDMRRADGSRACRTCTNEQHRRRNYERRTAATCSST